MPYEPSKGSVWIHKEDRNYKVIVKGRSTITGSLKLFCCSNGEYLFLGDKDLYKWYNQEVVNTPDDEEEII